MKSIFTGIGIGIAVGLLAMLFILAKRPNTETVLEVSQSQGFASDAPCSDGLTACLNSCKQKYPRGGDRNPQRVKCAQACNKGFVACIEAAPVDR